MEPPLASPTPDAPEIGTTTGVFRAVKTNNWLTAVIGGVVAIATAFFGYLAKRGGEDVQQQIESVRKADADAHHEMREDIRDLYRTIMVGRPSERLERPPEDGGKP